MTKRTSTGMQRKGSPSGEKHVFTVAPAVAPRYESPSTSWWAVSDRETFKKNQTDNEERMRRVPISIPHKDAL